MASPKQANDYLSTAREYVEDEGWATSTRPDESDHIHYRFKQEGTPEYVLAHPAKNADFLVVGLGLPGQSFNELVNKVDESQYPRLFNGLKLDLLRLGVDFNGVSPGTNNITIYTKVYFDGLNRQTFWKAFQGVKNSKHAIGWHLGTYIEGNGDVSAGTAGGHGPAPGTPSPDYIL